MRDAITMTAVSDLSRVEDIDDTCEMSVEGLYDAYARSLYRHAYAITRSAEDAEDVLQEVFGKIAQNPKRLVCPEAMKTYLFTAVRNASYSILRSRRRRGDLAQAWADDYSLACPDAAAGIIEYQVIRYAFAALPTEQREALVLKIYDEMSFREIAEAVGTSINTVASRYRYAIGKLREALEDDEDER